MMFEISSASWSSKLNQYFPLAQVACLRKIYKYGWSSEKCCKDSSQNWWIYSRFNLYWCQEYPQSRSWPDQEIVLSDMNFAGWLNWGSPSRSWRDQYKSESDKFVLYISVTLFFFYNNSAFSEAQVFLTFQHLSLFFSYFFS